MDNNYGMGPVPKREFSIPLVILMFAMGALSTIDVSLVGRVLLSEILMFFALPILLVFSRGGSLWNKNFKKCLWILALIGFGVIISDIYNQNYFWFTARSIARPIFTFFFFIFFILVFKKDPLVLCYYIFGKVISGVIKYYRPSDFESTDTLDVDTYAGLAFRVIPLITAVALAVCVLLFYWKKFLVSPALFATGVFIAVIGGPRSVALTWLLASALCFWMWLMHGRGVRRVRMTYGRLFGICAIGLIAMSVIYLAYIYAAPRGLLGEDQQAKLVEQEKTILGNSPLGLLLSGRTQAFAAVLGIMDRPIMGFGSWRSDLTSVYIVDAIVMVGTDPNLIRLIAQNGSSLGAGHSVIFQSWVENGILVAVGYIMIFSISIKCLIFFIKNQCILSPYFIFTTCAFAWSFFFSPPGIWLRFDAGIFMAVYVVFMDERRPLQHVHALFLRGK